MLEVTKVRISPNLPGIGKDLDVGATLNADVVADQPDLLAFTLMLVTPGVGPGALPTMVKAAFGDLANPANLIGVLAADSYFATDGILPAPAAVTRPAMVYREGTFLRSTVNEVNMMDGGPTAPPWANPIEPGDATEHALGVKGIFLEASWDEPALG